MTTCPLSTTSTGYEQVVARIILRGVDIEATGLVSAAGDVEATWWQGRGGGPIWWTPTARETRSPEERFFKPLVPWTQAIFNNLRILDEVLASRPGHQAQDFSSFPFTDERGQPIGRNRESIRKAIAPDTVPFGTIFNIDDLKTRVRMDTLIECLDWDRDGAVDDEVVKAFAADVEGTIIQRVRAYQGGQPLTIPRAEAVASLHRIAIQYALGKLGASYPNHFVVDHKALLSEADNDLALVFGE